MTPGAPVGGRPGVCLLNLGCRVNRVELDLMASELEAAGAVLVDEAEADAIVVNTCAVTGEAEAKTRKAVRRAAGMHPPRRPHPGRLRPSLHLLHRLEGPRARPLAFARRGPRGHPSRAGQGRPRGRAHGHQPGQLPLGARRCPRPAPSGAARPHHGEDRRGARAPLVHRAPRRHARALRCHGAWGGARRPLPARVPAVRLRPHPAPHGARLPDRPLPARGGRGALPRAAPCPGHRPHRGLSGRNGRGLCRLPGLLRGDALCQDARLPLLPPSRDARRGLPRPG